MTPAGRCSAALAANCRMPPPSTTNDGGVANTNIIFHAGRLLALEEGHLPTEIEPGTLGRLGYCDYQSAIQGPFTAHPKIDPKTGELVFFGYNAAGPLTPDLSFGSVNSSGVVTRFDRFEAPYASMVHDFIVTENHLLFPILPVTGSMERAMRGRPPYAWEPDKGAYVGVMKRNGLAKDIAWFRAESCYVFHVMNAWEEGSSIVADVMQFEEAPLFDDPDGTKTDPKKNRARYCRWTFDLAGNTDHFTQTYLDDLTGEFPRIDDRRAGLASSHGWYACANRDLPMFGALSGIVHVNGAGKRLGHYLLPAGDTISEPVFVERGNDVAEGDGWLLAVVWRARENRSDLAVFNATDVEAGPVALVRLGHRVPAAFTAIGWRLSRAARCTRTDSVMAGLVPRHPRFDRRKKRRGCPGRARAWRQGYPKRRRSVELTHSFARHLYFYIVKISLDVASPPAYRIFTV
jgi:carotenoid cleavage dioxygenase-like enzyme